MIQLVSTPNFECGYIENKLINIDDYYWVTFYPTEIKPNNFERIEGEGYYWVTVSSMLNPRLFCNDTNNSGTSASADKVMAPNGTITSRGYTNEAGKDTYNYRDIEDIVDKINEYAFKMVVPPVDGSTILAIQIKSSAKRLKFELVRRKRNETSHVVIGKLNADNNFTYLDYMIEQGEDYEYGIKYDIYKGEKDYEQGGSSTFCFFDTSAVTADFEDVFLSDKDHSLRIRFNPKISSFKTVLQEQKIETLSGQFPFVVRNGNLKYREFPLGGLISYEMDDCCNFEGRPDILRALRFETPGVDLIRPLTSSQKIYAERKFKLAVQEWLTNGQPKVFRSPTEGNYIIRLMNVSLSPEEKLGRMLHSFTATAYEVDEYNFANLKKYGVWPEYAEEYETLPIATNNSLGVVKGSLLENYIRVLEDGSMAINPINIAQLVQGTEEIVFDANE